MTVKTTIAFILASAVLTACNNNAAPPPDQASSAAPAADDSAPATAATDQTAYTSPAPQPVVSVYQDPPVEQPAPVAIASAPPPMLVEPPPPQPQADYIWTGGYWGWYGRWVWIHGLWAPPPRPHYHWIQPYYDHRGGQVVFVGSFWAAPNVSFHAPGLNISLSLSPPLPGYQPGPPPMGPEGVFVPPPPGSVFGIIVPAPIGTSPAVMMGAPPAIAVGMRVNNVVNNNTTTNITNTTTNTTINNTTINNTTINNVTISAPANATATHQAVNVTVPAQAHLAAALPPVVRVAAPMPATKTPIAAYVPGHPVELPAPQTVRAEVPSELVHTRAEAREAPPGGSMKALPGSPAMSSAEARKEQQAAAAKDAAKKKADADEARQQAAQAASERTHAAQADADTKRAQAKEARQKTAESAAEKRKAADTEAAKKKADETRQKPAETAAEKKKAADAAAAKKKAAAEEAEKRKEAESH
jgi:hypothetical protein